MSISADEVRQIARLARLELTDREVERFRGELSIILEYVARIATLDAGPPDGARAADGARPLREDRVEPWADVSALHRQAPDFGDGFFRVPRVVE